MAGSNRTYEEAGQAFCYPGGDPHHGAFRDATEQAEQASGTGLSRIVRCQGVDEKFQVGAGRA
jgi:hypothetical protein